MFQNCSHQITTSLVDQQEKVKIQYFSILKTHPNPIQSNPTAKWSRHRWWWFVQTGGIGIECPGLQPIRQKCSTPLLQCFRWWWWWWWLWWWWFWWWLWGDDWVQWEKAKSRCVSCAVCREYTLYIVCTVQSIVVHHDVCSKTFPQGRWSRESSWGSPRAGKSLCCYVRFT